ncbi:hypothetical protein [Fastidiosibacter lacustris]|uniref:hypothetical protein n=1 Tax=Fastidiosibacter lacustris TaxID=2056695 RepID=UPI000E34A1AB|nr:hypothetical protein [Fastidiosibacter lacustris]
MDKKRNIGQVKLEEETRITKLGFIIVTISITIVILIGVFYYISHGLGSRVSSDMMDKVAHQLKAKYGENFKVISGNYNRQSRSYTFTVIPESMPDQQLMVITDLTGKGSFASNYLLVRTSIEVAKMLEPYFKSVSDNFAARTLATSIYDKDLPENERYLAKETEYIFRSKALHLQEWIREYHNALELTFTAIIEIQKIPQNLLTLMSQIYKLNNYLLSLKLFSFNMEIRLVDIPDESWLKQQKMDTSFFIQQKGYEMNKYTWGVLMISDCPMNGIMKFCYGKPNIPEYANIAQSIHSPLDVAKYIKLLPMHTVKYKTLSGKVEEIWIVARRYDSSEAQFLTQTDLYNQIVTLYDKEISHE